MREKLWWIHEGDNFEMLVAESLCWWLREWEIENQSSTSKHRFILYFMVKGFLIFQFFFQISGRGGSGVLIPNINLKFSISFTGGR